jgi:hypothetical protein
MSDFAAAVQRMRAAMGADPWTSMPEPVPEGPPASLQARRRAGRDAYQRALEARGTSQRAAQVFAAAHWLFEGLED